MNEHFYSVMTGAVLLIVLCAVLSIAAIILSGSRSSSQGDIVKIATGFVRFL